MTSPDFSCKHQFIALVAGMYGSYIISFKFMYFCTRPLPGPRLPTWYVVDLLFCFVLFCLFLFNDLRGEVIVRIDGIVDHHCLNFLFITLFFMFDPFFNLSWDIYIIWLFIVFLKSYKPELYLKEFWLKSQVAFHVIYSPGTSGLWELKTG